MIPASLAVSFGALQPQLEKLSDFLFKRLQSELSDLHVVAITRRTKSAGSAYQKLQTGKYATLSEINDLVGLTVVVLYRHEVRSAIGIVKDSNLQVTDSPPRAVSASDFKYREPKLFISPPKDYLDRNPELEGLAGEVQFTTALQHALDISTHDFDYKGQSYAWSNFRLVAQLRGMLELVDGMLDDISSMTAINRDHIEAPADFTFASEILSVLDNRFETAALPADRRRLADTVAGWARSLELSAGDIDSLLGRHGNLIEANSIDATTAVLGAILTEHAEDLVEKYPNRLLITAELESICHEVSKVPADRRVRMAE